MLGPMRALQVASSLAVSVFRLGSGLRVTHGAKTPEKLLELYEFEACPYCRKVRETLSALDLDASVFPCPRGGERFRPTAIAKAGKRQFPVLVDPNTDTAMCESDDIVRYLTTTYGDGGVPLALRFGPLTDVSLKASSIFRAGRGRSARPSRAPKEPLELWSFEASPYCRLVRETLSTLEIPYVLHNVAKGSAKREAFVARSGKMQVPYLVDPNTGKEMFESADIVRYLEETYGA